MDIAVRMDHKLIIKESEKRQVHRHWQRTKKAMGHESNGDTNYYWRAWNGPQRLGKGLEDLDITERNEIIEITALLRSPKIVWRIPETGGDLLSFQLQLKTIS